MRRLTAKIEIQSARKWEFDKVTSIEITRDIETLTDLCILELPKKVKWHGRVESPLKRGDKLNVWLGYDHNMELAFSGYITTIGFKSPMMITCEDEMFTFKSKEAKKLSYRNVTIEKLLADQNIGVPFKVFGEQNIGQYRITANTISELLGHLKDNGIRSFFKNENGVSTLYCGVLFPKSGDSKQVFRSGSGPALNIIDDKQLEVQNAKDVRIKVKAVSLLPNNKKIRCEVGDPDGETRTIHTYNKSEQELKAWATQELDRLKRDGLVGSFTTFGYKLVDKLDNIGMIIDAERKGIYQVQKNVVKYGPSGYRQEITIGARVL